MYDLDGTDTKREWVEVHNNESSDINLESWKFFESGTNHGLSIYQGSPSISAGGYAIIADDPASFLLDYPGFSGSIFDSSFSLLNTGEYIALKNASLSVIDEVTYSSDWGGSGDGKSLQYTGSEFSSGTPTPGAENVTGSSSNTTLEDESATTEEESSEKNEKQICLKSTPRDVTIRPSSKTIGQGMPIVFDTDIYACGFSYSSGYFFWNFGDGNTMEYINQEMKDNVSHVYYYPGEYVVTLEYRKSILSDTPDDLAQITIQVLPKQVIISAVTSDSGPVIELSNTTSMNADLSGWILESRLSSFIIPRGTVILANRKVSFRPSITLFSFNNLYPLTLKSPDGNTVSVFPQTPPLKTYNPAPISPKSIEKETKDNLVFSSSQLASVGALQSQNEISPTALFALFGLVLAGIAGVLALRWKKNTPDILNQGPVDDIEIIE